MSFNRQFVSSRDISHGTNPLQGDNSPAVASVGLRSSDPSLVKKLEAEADECYQSVLLPINERMFGPLPQAETITARPMVLLLGNHSSGKSTFINHLLNAEVQKSGVAPTDDCFTLITSGQEDTEMDGPALVGDPDLGFMALRNKGSALISHINLKVRKDVALKNVILVDSPGMIDCPAVSTSQAHIAIYDALRLDGERTKGERAPKVYDRGFDFMDVIKWFAEHSDVILLFFDPDKPGTTGETLECLTTALSGMEHKLLIVFNKCDQFTKIHDFARAFGALCWNLSKVIPRKDLPPIYTMCVPVENLDATGLGAVALADLHATRQEVIQKIHNAQERRVDNMISRLDDATRVLQMYAWVCTAVRRRLGAEWWAVHARALACFAGLGAAAAAAYYGRDELAARLGERYRLAYLPALVGGQTIALGYYLVTYPAVARMRQQLTEDWMLTELFRDKYRMEIADGDQYLLSLWIRVRARVKEAMAGKGIDAIGHVTRKDNEYLDRILKQDVPRLRRQFARAIGDGGKVFDATPA